MNVGIAVHDRGFREAIAISITTWKQHNVRRYRLDEGRGGGRIATVMRRDQYRRRKLLVRLAQQCLFSRPLDIPRQQDTMTTRRFNAQHAGGIIPP